MPSLESLEPRSLFAAVSFSNAVPIQIPANGTGDYNGAISEPGPSTVEVSGLDGTISKLTVSLEGLQHSYDLDIDIVLAGPTGRSVLLMSDAGDARTGSINIVFDDSGPRLPVFMPITSGTYRPTNFNNDDALPAPIPANSSGLLSTFNGTSPNGTWSLYVLDDSPGDVGVLQGWTLSITSDFTPPQVVHGAFLDGSSTHRLQYAFNKSVAQSVASGEFSVLSLADNQLLPATDFAADYDFRTNTLGLNYANGVLPDGYYRLQMNAAQVYDEAAIQLDGNGDGVGGDDYYYDFAFLAADTNRDRVVDSVDFATLAANYGKTTYVHYFAGDFDFNGRVNTSDFNILSGQFGRGLGPLPAPPPNVGPSSGLAAPSPSAGLAISGGPVLPMSSSPFSEIEIKVGDRVATLIDWG